MPTQISAKVIAHSVGPTGEDLITYILEYNRFIHAEFMTYGSWSKNASSSRAIPVEKQIKRVMEDPAMPVFWGKNQAGMQAAEELSSIAPSSFGPLDHVSMESNEHFMSPKQLAIEGWLRARDSAVLHVKSLHGLGLHKQLANRILEPWTWISVVATATKANRNNLYNQRYHKDAQPEFQALAKAMWEAEKASVPVKLHAGDWHLPFIIDRDRAQEPKQDDPLFLPKISAARCARTSYNNHDGTNPLWEKDLELFAKLMSGKVKHASPTCHQARVPIPGMDTFLFEAHDVNIDGGMHEHLRSNLKDWVQLRKLIPGEFLPTFEGPTP
jgi:hypothetical protein